MRKSVYCIVVASLLGLTPVALRAADLVFDSFEEAEKAAEQRGAEYDKRMKEHVATVNGAWEKQNTDLGTNSNPDISKITETRHTEQSSEKEEHTQLQDNVSNTIGNLKNQMVSTSNANTIGFAGAVAAYSWKVSCKNGKYILSDTYDEAMFVSGASGNSSEKITTPGNDEPQEASGNSNASNNDSDDVAENAPDVNSETPDEETSTADEPDVSNLSAENENEPDEKNVNEPEDESQTNDKPLVAPDRCVTLTIQHPVSFEEETFTVDDKSEAKILKLDKFSIPEDTRVKISAKANMENVESTLTMTIVDDEGESEPIDSVSMRNYRHLFRIPSQDEYSVNIYVNEPGKEPRKIMQLCIPVIPVDFDTRTITNK